MPVLAILTALPAAAQNQRIASESQRVSADRVGAVPTRDNLRLRLLAGVGSVNIFTDGSREVRYRVHLESAPGDPAGTDLINEFLLTVRNTPRGVTLAGAMPGGDLARIQVGYEIHVPRRYDLEVSTEGGDIVVQDIEGRVALSTGGGDIRTGNIGIALEDSDQEGAGGLVARLDTGGGHIVTGNIAGTLRAVTAGGHITAGDISGDAILRTGGGYIRIGRVVGAVRLFSGGGNILAGSVGSGAFAETAGGRIEFGTAAGLIHAHSGGGGVRIAHLAGPTQLDSGEGGISVAGVEAPLRVSAAAGSITAFFSPLFSADSLRARGIRRPAEISELASGQGDIVVYLPKGLGVTIDARIEDGKDRRIVADPALPLRVNYEDSPAGRIVHGECSVNGGGEAIHLRTTAGNIELHYLDEGSGRSAHEQRIHTADSTGQSLTASESLPSAAAGRVPGEAGIKEGDEPAAGRLAVFMGLLDEWVSGGVPVDPEYQQERLVHSIPPAYPEVARQAGIEGEVSLRVWIGKDGAVKAIDVLSGNAVLARSAMRAVERWRYHPAFLGGWPVNVVTTVTLAFRLR